MAKATQPGAAGKAADAIALLKQDHRTVEAGFEEFEKADDDELGTIAQRVCQQLTVHAQIEEEILYPSAKNAFESEEDLDLVNEANVEHGTAKQLIAQIESMDEKDELFKATVKVLSEYIKHHVKEEEGELFPKLKKTGIDLAEMGELLQARKKELMDELGIEEESDEAESGGSKRQRSRTGTRPSGHARH